MGSSPVIKGFRTFSSRPSETEGGVLSAWGRCLKYRKGERRTLGKECFERGLPCCRSFFFTQSFKGRTEVVP